MEAEYGDQPAIRRIFSQCRALGAKTLLIERIAPVGLAAEENRELRGLYPSHHCLGLHRLSFWRCGTGRVEARGMREDDLLGFAVLKCDRIQGLPFLRRPRWHVFESVVRKYPDAHNFAPGRPRFEVRVRDRVLTIEGALYCQQNDANKTCAHVALRSVLASLLPDGDIAYSELNRIARRAVNRPWHPRHGLDSSQVRAILVELGVGFTDLDYSATKGRKKAAQVRAELPYQRFLYAGVEAGAGALLGFQFDTDEGGEAPCHMVPLFGHTFNGDTWVPNADAAYFRIGKQTRYIPCDSWANSFIGHDDNFGSNFCVPRLYVKPQQVTYVVALHREGFVSTGLEAEVVALRYLKQALQEVVAGDNVWLRRLATMTRSGRVVLRAVPVTRQEYVFHRRSVRDWEGRREHAAICQAMARNLPERLWMVEISVPELFPANKRKLGDVLLDGSVVLNGVGVDDPLICVQLPGSLKFVESYDAAGMPNLLTIESNLTSHVPVHVRC